MTQENKQLLLKDLCARLPYGLILDVDTADWKAPQGHIQLKIEGIGILFKDMSLIVNGSYYGDNYKPYLRPMSSMTKEECIELGNIEATIENIGEVIPNAPYYIEVISSKQIDWLNAHHFDYRGLIEKGLAIEAPEGMYNKNKIMCYMCEDKQYCSQSEYVKKNCYKLK